MAAPPPQADLTRILLLDPTFEATAEANQASVRTFRKPPEFHCLCTFEPFDDCPQDEGLGGEPEADEPEADEPEAGEPEAGEADESPLGQLGDLDVFADEVPQAPQQSVDAQNSTGSDGVGATISQNAADGSQNAAAPTNNGWQADTNDAWQADTNDDGQVDTNDAWQADTNDDGQADTNDAGQADTNTGGAARTAGPTVRGQPQGEDRWRGIQLLGSVPSRVPQPVPDSQLQLGHTLPPARARRPPREPGERQAFDTQYERERFFIDLEARKQRQREAAEEREAEEGAGAAGGNKRSTCRLKVFTHDFDYRAHLALVINLQWEDATGKHLTPLTLRLPGDSTFISFHEPMTEELLNDYRDELAAGLVHDDPTAYVVAIEYDPSDRVDGVWATNIVASGDFGPFQPEVEQLRSFTVHGGRIELVASHASSLGPLMDSVIAQMEVDAEIDPYWRFWTGTRGKQHLFRHKNIPPPTDITSTVGNTRISFASAVEFQSMHMVALKRDFDWVNSQLTLVKRGQAARFMRLDGAGNENCLLVFIDEDPEDPLLLQDGDDVDLRIRCLNPTDVDGCNWKGQVEPALANFNATDRVIMAKRRFDKETLQPLGLDVSALGQLPSLQDITDLDSIANLIDAQAPRAVDITIVADRRAHDRAQKTLSQTAELFEREKRADPHGVSQSEDYLCGNRYDRLQIVNALEHISPRIRDMMSQDLSPPQQDVLRELEHMIGGHAHIEGCAGAGKTYAIIVVLAYAVLDLVEKHKDEAEPKAARAPLRALICSPINANADNVAQDLRVKMVAIGVTDGIVLRKHSKETAKKLAYTHADHQRNDAPPPSSRFDADAAAAALEDAEPGALQIVEELRKRHAAPFPQDRRVTPAGMAHSPSEYLFMAADIVPTPSHLAASIARLRVAIPSDMYNALSDAFASYVTLQEVDPASRTRLSEAIRDCLAIVYNASDAIVTTVQQAMDSSLWLYYKTEMIVLEEAAKMNSSEGLVWTHYPGCHFRIHVGDSMQSRPVVRSPAHANTFGPQLEFAQHSRQRVAGNSFVEQNEEHRYGPDIKGIIGDIFYQGRITIAPRAVPALNAGAARFKRFLTAKGLKARVALAAESTVAVLNVAETQEVKMSVGGSKYNPHIAAVTWVLVEQLLDFGYTPADIGIVTPYSGMRTMFEGIANRWAIDHDVHSLQNGGFMIETCERAQSQQRRILIFSVPTTDAMGFMNAPPRLNTGLSRVQHGLLIVADLNALRSLTGYSDRTLSRIIDWCKERRLIYAVKKVAEDSPVWKYIPTIVKREERPTPLDSEEEPIIALDDPQQSDDTTQQEGDTTQQEGGEAQQYRDVQEAADDADAIQDDAADDAALAKKTEAAAAEEIFDARADTDEEADEGGADEGGADEGGEGAMTEYDNGLEYDLDE